LAALSKKVRTAVSIRAGSTAAIAAAEYFGFR
jgi:hypothetical protein